MISILDTLGLYIGALNHAFTECEDALKSVFLDSKVDDLGKKAQEALTERGLDWSDPTNSLISLMFEITETIINNEYPSISVHTYVNGYDSHFDVYDVEVYEAASEAGIDAEIIKMAMVSGILIDLPVKDATQSLELMSDTDTFKDMHEAFVQGGDFTVYESLEELGEDNADNDCREKDDTDEEFGQYLIDAYHNGSSNVAYFKFEDGSILAISRA